MAARKTKKKNKLRGQRLHGHGNTKNRRGGGYKGGIGRAGSHKHKYSKYYMDFGGRIKLKPKGIEKAINLGELLEKIPQFAQEGKVEKTADGTIVDGKKIGFNKILGKGSIMEKIIVRNMKASKNAVKKIMAAGGKVEGAEGKQEVEEKGEKSGEEEGEFEAEEGESESEGEEFGEAADESGSEEGKGE